MRCGNCRTGSKEGKRGKKRGEWPARSCAVIQARRKRRRVQGKPGWKRGRGKGEDDRHFTHLAGEEEGKRERRDELIAAG